MIKLNKSSDPVALIPQNDGSLSNFTTGQQKLSLDVIFPILHGPFGEDGTVQGLLKLAKQEELIVIQSRISDTMMDMMLGFLGSLTFVMFKLLRNKENQLRVKNNIFSKTTIKKQYSL